MRTDHTAINWAEGGRRRVEEDFVDADRITWVMNNRNTHTGVSRYRAFAPDPARRLLEKLALVYTPKQGSGLNRAECEFSVRSRPGLNRR